jgi:hypothetical protein
VKLAYLVWVTEVEVPEKMKTVRVQMSNRLGTLLVTYLMYQVYLSIEMRLDFPLLTPVHSLGDQWTGLVKVDDET